MKCGSQQKRFGSADSLYPSNLWDTCAGEPLERTEFRQQLARKNQGVFISDARTQKHSDEFAVGKGICAPVEQFFARVFVGRDFLEGMLGG
jgi:hypothetical protein